MHMARPRDPRDAAIGMRLRPAACARSLSIVYRLVAAYYLHTMALKLALLVRREPQGEAHCTLLLRLLVLLLLLLLLLLRLLRALSC